MNITDISVSCDGCHEFSAKLYEGVCHRKTLPWISVVQALEGTYDIQINDGNPLSTQEGGIFLAPSSVLQTITHHINATTGTGRYRWVFLKIKVNQQHDFDELFSYPLIPPKEILPAFHQCLDAIQAAEDIFSKKAEWYRLAKLIYMLSSPKTPSKALSKLTPAVNYITAHFTEPISVDSLAKMCYLSKSSFFSLFQKEKLKTPIQYINAYRLSIASENILFTDTPISTVAKEVGFADYAYFNKCFRKVYGVPPTEYRKLSR